MLRIIFILLFNLLGTIAFASEIQGRVIFENLTNREFITGVFTIVDLNQKIELTNTDNFEITLPEKGKYQFVFSAEGFITKTVYPKRITKRKNTIVIQLIKFENTNLEDVYHRGMPSKLNLTDAEIQDRIFKGTLNFIIHGIDNTIPERFVNFKDKYGVGLLKENCVLDPLSYHRAVENNQMISNYLNKKYGTQWLSDLKTKPIGVK